MLQKYKLIDFRTINDKDGKLTVFENSIELPFDIKRVFMIYDVPKSDIMRANHASLNTMFILQAITGHVDIELDDGRQKAVIRLDRIDEGLYINKMVWMKCSHFSENCILQVYASEDYSQCKYIEDYDRFLKDGNVNEKNSDCGCK